MSQYSFSVLGINYKFINMKLLKTLVVVTLISVNALPALAFTEITSAPRSVLSSATLDVSKGCTLLMRAWDLNDSDEEIQLLTQYLKKEGFYKGTVTKKYTKAVKTAVAKFQLEKGIIKNENSEVLGVLTASTREYISDKTCAKKDIETPKTSCVFITRSLSTETQNDSRFSDDTRTLQRFLVQKGYLSSTFVTGSFGSVTKEALARFQFDNGIVASITSDSAGIAGPRTREFLASNTCGSADVERTTEPTRTGFRVSLTTRTGVEISTKETEQVLRINLRPQERNAQITELTLQVVAPTSTNPITYIDGFEFFHKGQIISRARGTNAFKAVDGLPNNYYVKLTGSSDMLERGGDYDLTVRVIPSATAPSRAQKTFGVFIPKDGFKVQFSDSNLNAKGVEEWGSPTQKSTFVIGKPESTNTGSSTNATTTTPTTSTSTVSNTNTVVEIKTPELNWVRPDNGAFGEDLVLRGIHFAPTKNQIKLVHVRTGVSTIIHGLASKDNQIHFNFPGKGREFLRPNGKKVTPNDIDLTGNYRVYVISNGKESNWILYKVNK